MARIGSENLPIVSKNLKILPPDKSNVVFTEAKAILGRFGRNSA